MCVCIYIYVIIMYRYARRRRRIRGYILPAADPVHQGVSSGAVADPPALFTNPNHQSAAAFRYLDPEPHGVVHTTNRFRCIAYARLCCVRRITQTRRRLYTGWYICHKILIVPTTINGFRKKCVLTIFYHFNLYFLNVFYDNIMHF